MKHLRRAPFKLARTLRYLANSAAESIRSLANCVEELFQHEVKVNRFKSFRNYGTERIARRFWEELCITVALSLAIGVVIVLLLLLGAKKTCG